MTGSTAARDAAFLTGGEDFERVLRWRVVAAIAGIGEDAFEGVADERFDRRNNLGQGVAVVRRAAPPHE